MKKLISFLVIILFLTYSPKTLGQIDVDLTDIKTNKTIPFSQIFETYKIDPKLPTMFITWSGEWCKPCIELIERYNICDLSMVNIITVNVDSEVKLKEIIQKGYHTTWTKTFNFHGNLGENKKGFDNVFNVSLAPLVLFFENGKMTDALIKYDLFPYLLLDKGRVTDIKFIWNSQKDLNELAWSFYLNVNDKALLEQAKTWASRSIELNKNYHNTDTLAALLFKTGNYTEALKMAKQAIEIAKTTGTDYNTTTNLINQIIEKL